MVAFAPKSRTAQDQISHCYARSRTGFHCFAGQDAKSHVTTKVTEQKQLRRNPAKVRLDSLKPMPFEVPQSW
jgi:hypothetical protein